MKNYLLILISLIFLMPFTGCKKKSFDPTVKTHEDFIGTWKGTISTFKNNQLLKENGTIYLYPDAATGKLSGILFMKETNVFHEFQFVDGTVYFKIVNNDPENPICQNWSLGGYIVFSADNTLDIRINGNECGQSGSEFISWAGSMGKIVVSPDSVKYYNFGKTGNDWTYKVILKTGDSCQVQKQINTGSASFLYNGATTHSCGWAAQSMTFSWRVAPDAFSIVNDSTLGNKPFVFSIDAKPGVVYRTTINLDTTTVTLLDTNQVVITPSGNFKCAWFRYTEPVYSGLLKTNRTSYIWLNNIYGVIKQEVINPVDSTDVQSQLLSTKNF